jgi:hypothetical protein
VAAAVICVGPVAKPCAVKLPVLLPLGIVTVGGSTSTIPVGEDERAMVTPPLPAGALIVTVPLTVLVKPMFATIPTEIVAGVTFTVDVAAPKPTPETVMWAVPVPVGVTGILTPVDPADTDAVAGTLAMLVLSLDRISVSPFCPAGAGKVAVRFVGVPPLVSFAIVNGSGDKVIDPPEVAVIMTVTGLLFVNPSLTINCTT